MGKEIEKEPDFYPFRIKDHGWVLKKGVSTETIGEAFKDMVYELVTKDFTPGSIAESMHNDALTMIDERAAKARKAAKTRWQKAQEGAAKKNPQDAPHGNAGVDSKSATSCGQFTADGDVREDSHDGKSGTSANIYGTRQAKNGDAARREAADGESDGNVVSDRANVSKPLALDMPGPDKASDPSGHNTGNVPPSHGHEDGNLYDQETIGISTDEKSTGGQSPLSQSPYSRPPVRDRRVSGDVMSLAYSGEFGNVRLTQEQYGELGIKFGNLAKLNRAIDSLSCKLENDELKPVPRSHYAVLVKWASYREDMEEQKIQQSEAPKMTEMEKSWIREAEKIARYEKELAANVRR